MEPSGAGRVRSFNIDASIIGMRWRFTEMFTATRFLPKAGDIGDLSGHGVQAPRSSQRVRPVSGGLQSVAAGHMAPRMVP
jgi:hypothetical protein